MGGVSVFLHTPMIDCCNAQLQIPKRDILLSFEHKIDRSFCIHNKMDHVMFHETVPQKLLVFTLYGYPYMSNAVSHFNLLDEFITTFGMLFWCCFFNSKFQRTTAENLIRRHLGYVASDLDLHCLPTSHKMEASRK